MYISSVATPPTVRAEWAFKIFDSDGDQLLGENDIRSRHQDGSPNNEGTRFELWGLHVNKISFYFEKWLNLLITAGYNAL